MPTAQLGAVLRHIRNLAADSKGKLQTDGELLRSFLARKDQGAFETMVRRHGPMVLQVCRRVLGNLHDAEDAFQATFLVLAQQVVSIRKRESLASWLHGVAYRMATNARRAAARRRKHEQQARLVRPRDPATRAAWQEIQVALDEEIQRLPAIYREPFVLCCLEHKSCAEAASRLSQKEGAVWNRLTRARKMLQERLARRGVSLTAALAAVGLSADAVLAAVPHSLLCSTVKGAVQVAAGQALTSVVPAQVIALVKGANQAMLLTKCKTAMLLLLSAGVVGSGLGLAVLRGADPEAPKESQSPAAKASSTPGRSEAQPAKAEPKKDDAQVEVRGRVLDPDGKPFAGAKLYLHAPNFRDKGYAVRATSDDNGRFQLTFAKSELTAPDDPQQSPTGQVMAVAKGYGCDWASIVADGKAGELTLRLVKDLPINGRLLDPDRKPFAGPKVTGPSISPPKGLCYRC